MSVQRYLYLLGSVVMTFYVLSVTQSLLVPLVLAIFVWYLIKVLANTVSKIPLGDKRLPVWLSYILAILSILGTFALLGAIISRNVAGVVDAAPVYQRNLDILIARIYEGLNLQEPPRTAQLLKDYDFASLISQAALAMTGLISRSGLILIYMAFLFVEQKTFLHKLDALVKTTERRHNLTLIIQRIDEDIRSYISIKTLVSIMTAVGSYIILRIVGLDFAEFWALIIFVFNYIPSIGSIIATLLPSLIALVQFESHWPFIIIVGGVTFVQIVVANVIEPRLMGTSLNMSPLVILLSLVLWGNIWGVTGMFLCIPIMVIAMIIFSHFPQTRPIAILLSQTGDVR